MAGRATLAWGSSTWGDDSELNVFEAPADEIVGERTKMGGRGAIDHFAVMVGVRSRPRSVAGQTRRARLVTRRDHRLRFGQVGVLPRSRRHGARGRLAQGRLRSARRSPSPRSSVPRRRRLVTVDPRTPDPGRDRDGAPAAGRVGRCRADRADGGGRAGGRARTPVLPGLVARAARSPCRAATGPTRTRPAWSPSGSVPPTPRTVLSVIGGPAGDPRQRRARPHPPG